MIPSADAFTFGAQGPQFVLADCETGKVYYRAAANGQPTELPGGQGPAGPPGPEGPEGPQGVQGDAGTDGAAGAQGPQGQQGIQGPAGTDGAAGPQGDAGAQGQQGIQGIQGIQGAQGDPGAPGAAGLTLIRLMVAPRTFTNLGAGPTEISAQDRAVVDLTGRTNCRVFAHVSTQGVTGVFRAQYSLDASAWVNLTNTVAAAGTGLKASASAAIPAGAKALCILRFVATGGNTTEDPVVNAAVVEIT